MDLMSMLDTIDYGKLYEEYRERERNPKWTEAQEKVYRKAMNHLWGVD